MFQFLEVKLRECYYSVFLFCVNLRYNGQTLLMYYAHEGNTKMVKTICTVLSQTDKLGDMSCMDNSDNTKLCVARWTHRKYTTTNLSLSKR